MTTLQLPWPPSTNHHYAHSRYGVRLTGAARAWRQEVALLVAQHMAPTPPLEITVFVAPPDKRRRDPDNLLKETLDAVLGAWGIDDSLANIKSLSMLHGTPGQERGTIAVVVTGGEQTSD